MWSETRRPEFLTQVVGHPAVKSTLATYLAKKPYSSVVLLHGPPGIGKTTIALASARSCGMEPLEINASQSMRSFDDVERLIQSCRHSRSISSMIRGDHKPLCLILDEIDGSDPHAQRKLVEWMTGDQRTIPVIMTCNEVPRILKQKEKVDVVRCFPPSPDDLKELFPAENVAQLAKRFKHDVRRILQFLQYGESDLLPAIPLPTDCSPEVLHMIKQKTWSSTDPMVLATSSETSSSRCPS